MGQRGVDDRETGGSGGRSIAGYEYQIDVSVWLALDLVLASQLSQQLTLEPASEEDVEADLAEDRPGQVTTVASLAGYRLVVQAKLRSGDAWTVAAVKALLMHGSDQRPSAAVRLKDPKVRYLLVTSAALNGLTQDLRIRRAGSWPVSPGLPASIRKVLPSGAAGRVAIIGNEDEERIRTDISTLLTDSFRVPKSRLETCRRALRDQARARIAGAGAGVWTRDQLEQTIRQHDGYVASSPELAYFVHPTNWSDLRAAMSKRHAAIIVGQSGTGKTTATHKLFDELRNEIPGLTRVPITLGPGQLHADTTEPPVLYDIVDPWGRFDFDPASRPWNDQLSLFFARARPNRMVVATSRQDVALSSNALETVRPWVIGLEAEHYGRTERRRLYRNRIDDLPRAFQVIARDSETAVLAELATPLEIQKFFDALSMLDEADRSNPPALVNEAIRRAHQDSIEQTVVDQIGERDDVRAAAVLWGLFKANERLSLRLLRQIEERLQDLDPRLDRGVSPLVSFFVAARNLRQVDGSIVYYHPRVEAGVEQALSRSPVITRRTLKHLIDVLVSPNEPDDGWGIAASIRLLFALQRTPELRPEPASAAQAKVDAWFATELAKGGKGFNDHLDMAAALGSAQSNVSEAARFLTHRPHRGMFECMQLWGPPDHDDAWYARMQCDPEVRAVIETFVREVLPNTRDDYRAGFVAATERIAPGMTPAYMAAAATAVHYGVIYTDEAISEGALKDLAAFETIVDRAIEVRTPSAADEARMAELHLALVNREYSEDYAEHVANNDDGWTAGEFLAAYVDRVRATVGWQQLASHRHATHLAFYWLRALANQEQAADPNELSGAFSIAQGRADEADFWHVLVKSWNPAFESALVDRVLVGHADPRVQLLALTCLAEHAVQHLHRVCGDLLQRPARLVEIAIDLAEMRRHRVGFDGSPHEAAAAHALSSLPPPLSEISEAAFALDANAKTPTLSPAARTLLSQAEAASERVRVCRMRLAEHLPTFVPDDVRWTLEHTDDADNATHAVRAAIRHGMSAEVEAGLSHRFAAVVVESLQAIAAPLAPPLPQTLLDLAAHKGSQVRLALAAILDDKSHAHHLATLLQLAKDQWSEHFSYPQEGVHQPVARSAIGAMRKLGTLDETTGNELFRLALSSLDWHVRHDALVLVVLTAVSRLQMDVLELALQPGARRVREAAASALISGGEHVGRSVLERLTPHLLETKHVGVVSRLLLLLVMRGEIGEVLAAASALSANRKRRVLLLLAILVVRERDKGAAERIAAMLSPDHPGVRWALANAQGDIDDATLSDLGDAASVEAVLSLVKPGAAH